MGSNKDSIEKSHMLGGLLKARAKAHGWEFIDADIPEMLYFPATGFIWLRRDTRR